MLVNNLKLSFLLDNFIAHRGLHNQNIEKDKNKLLPENSLGAFQEAINKNYLIELDVHLLKDGTVVVFHDFNLKRMCGVDLIIEDLTKEYLKKYFLLDTQYQIPTLKEVLELSTTQKYLIETKQNFKDGLLEKATYELLKTYQGEYAIQSFNPYSVQWFYLNAPEVIRGQLGCSFKGNKEYSASQKKLYRTLEINKISQPHFVNYFFKETTNKVIMKARETMLILGWTVRSQKEYQKYEKYLDNITFENFKPTRRKNGI